MQPGHRFASFFRSHARGRASTLAAALLRLACLGKKRNLKTNKGKMAEIQKNIIIREIRDEK